MEVRFDIISIGTLARNRLWTENELVRTAHSTTTLIRSGKRKILVDPGLPPTAVVARLYERTGLKPDAIDAIFLTSIKPQHMTGIAAFPNAKLLINEPEQQFMIAQLQRLIEQAPEEDIDRQYMLKELELIESATPAEDKPADGVDLFPLPGYSPGACGLLVAGAMTSTLITGAAVPTQDHFLAAQVLPECSSIADAQESMREVYEIADLIVPGYDNVFLNPRMQGM